MVTDPIQIAEHAWRASKRRPHLTVAIYGVIVAVVFAVLGWAYAHRHNPRLLMGDEAVRANSVFDAIRTADQLAEDFTDGSDFRDASRQKAVDALAGWESAPHSEEGERAVAVYKVYLAAVSALPDIDGRCAHAKLAAHNAEDDYVQHKIDETAWKRGEVAYFACQAERSVIQNTIQVCHDESLSYLVSGMQPPLDSCLWRSRQQRVSRQR